MPSIISTCIVLRLRNAHGSLIRFSTFLTKCTSINIQFLQKIGSIMIDYVMQTVMQQLFGKKVLSTVETFSH